MLSRLSMAAAALAAALAAASATADVYTWVDASGKVNVSNLAPPAGARVTAVAKETATASERAEAVRKAAQDAEIRALADRVAELESAAQASRMVPPYGAPPMSAPLAYAAPPAPQFVVTTMPAADDAPPSPGYACAWVGCGLPYAGGFYAPVVVVAPGFNRRDRFGRRPHPTPARRRRAGAPAAHDAPRLTRASRRFALRGAVPQRAGAEARPAPVIAQAAAGCPAVACVRSRDY
jgi:hypothetical protein